MVVLDSGRGQKRTASNRLESVLKPLAIKGVPNRSREYQRPALDECFSEKAPAALVADGIETELVA